MKGSHRFRLRLRRRFYPPPPPTGTLSEPDAKLGSLTLIRHKMTLSHFSKGLIRPVSGGERSEEQAEGEIRNFDKMVLEDWIFAARILFAC